MALGHTTISRKGQVTIPVEIRRALGLAEGEQLEVEQHGDTVVLRRVVSVTDRTAGGLAHYAHTSPHTIDEERETFERALAEESAGGPG